MKHIRTPEDVHEMTEKQPAVKPQGIGMAVAFDWRLTVQFLVMPFIPFLLKSFGLLKQSNTTLISEVSLLTLPLAIVFALPGEGLRRGWRWTRIVQIVFNTLASVGGIGLLFTSIQRMRQGNLWSLPSLIILLIFSPLIAWRLSRPATGQWFRAVTGRQARKQHGGWWPWLIGIWSLVGGILVALAGILSSR